MVFKVNADERRQIEAKASRYAGGNISAYLRHAAIHFKAEGKG